MIKTKIEITLDPELPPATNINYHLTYPDCVPGINLSEVPDDAIYSAGRSIQAIFNLFETELLKRKSQFQLRTRKQRRGK